MASFVFDHLVRGQGRRFIYDSPTLEMALTEAGFADVRACESDRGEDALSRGDWPPPESLVLEATRPFPAVRRHPDPRESLRSR
jgi:hypothetical protein